MKIKVELDGVWMVLSTQLCQKFNTGPRSHRFLLFALAVISPFAVVCTGRNLTVFCRLHWL